MKKNIALVHVSLFVMVLIPNSQKEHWRVPDNNGKMANPDKDNATPIE